MAAPTVRSVGDVAISNGSALSVPLPASYVAGDLLLLYVHAGGGYTGDPSGWSGFELQDVGSGAESARLFLYWKIASASESAPTVPAFNDHTMARILAIQGAIGSGPYWELKAQGANFSNITSHTVNSPGDTTGPDRLSILAVATVYPDTTGTSFFSGWTNSSLTSVTEEIDNTTSMGGTSGAGLAVVTGVKAVAGNVGAFTFTTAQATMRAFIWIQVKPAPAPTTVTVPKATATALARVPALNIPTVVAAAVAVATALAAVPAATLRITASPATASAAAPLATGVLSSTAPAAAGIASAPAPAVTAHEPENVVIAVPAATASAGAPAPSGGAPVTVRPPVAGALAGAHPITFWNVHEPPAIASGASFLTPRRAGPEGTSLYTETVAGIVPPPIAVIDFDEHTGTSLIWGDPTGRSMVFDGVDDQHVAYLPYETGAWTVVLWFIDEKSTSGGHIYSDNENRLFVYKSGGAGDAGNEGRLCWNLTAGGPGFLFGPYVRDGLAHQVVLQCTGTVTKLYVDNVLEASVGQDQRFGGTGTFGQFNNAPATFFGGRIDEFSYFHGALSTEWLNELWWHGIGQGGPKTQLFAAKSNATAAARPPAFEARQVYDSWQLHYDPEVDGFELDPEEWTIVRGVPFLNSEGMRVPSGTLIRSRDWHSFSDWFAFVLLEEIPVTWQGTIEFRLVAALADKMVEGIFPSPPSPGPMSEVHEVQETWSTYVSNGVRYVQHSFGNYSPYWDDPEGYTLTPYNAASPLQHLLFRLHSPHSRVAQAFTGWESTLYQFSPGMLTSSGWLAYTLVREHYEVRLLRLEIEVSGDPSYSPVIQGINRVIRVTPATKIVVPTATYVTDYDMDELAYRVSYRTDFQGPPGPVRMRPPATLTTARMLRPPAKAQLGVENAAITTAHMPFPVWAGDKMPTVVFLPIARAGAVAVVPDIVGEPQDVLVEVPSAAGAGRMPAPSTGGIVLNAVGITRFSVTSRPVEIRVYGRPTTIAVLELVRR